MIEHDEELFQFFGGYFHQDWQDDDPTWQDVVKRFALDCRPHQRDLIAGKIEHMAATLATDEELSESVAALGCEYWAGSSAETRKWLMEVAHALRTN